ncbi:MAG: type II secretion system protein N, partial [Pseudomonadota bacterium]
FLFTRLIYTLITPLPSPEAVPVTMMASAPADLTIFARFDPFLGNMPPPPLEVYERAEETRLNLRLVGTYLDGENPSAIVESDNGQHPFFIGETIINGVTIKSIRTNQIILSRNGVTETLTLAGREGFAETADAPSAAADPIGAENLTPVISAGPSQIAVPSVFEDYLKLTSHPSGQGYLVYAGDQPTAFQRSGLMNGDHITAVRGKALPSDARQAFRVIGQAAVQGAVDVTIMRGGRPVNISIELSEFQ